MWTAFGIMLGYASGAVFHNVAGSGENFVPTDPDTGELVLRHSCPSGELLSLRCVSLLRNIGCIPWLTRSKELELEADAG
jgi:hypothetical protein